MCSQINSFAKKLTLLGKLKYHLGILYKSSSDNADYPNSNPLSQKSSYTRYLVIREIFVFINLSKLKKIVFAEIYFL